MCNFREKIDKFAVVAESLSNFSISIIIFQICYVQIGQYILANIPWLCRHKSIDAPAALV